MDRYRFSNLMVSLLGLNNWNRLQMKVKYFKSFRKLYHNKALELPSECYVYVADGSTAHGGISDRLRGITGVYQYCKSRNIPFRIYFVHPFNLDQFLIPNKYNWKLRDNEFVRNNKVGFRFFNAYSHMWEKKNIYFSLLDSHRKQVHCYTNVTINESNMHTYFNELFQPSDILQQALDKCLIAIQGGYVSITFRFQNLLGDLHERYAVELPTDKEKKDYINHCLSAIEKVHETNKDFYDKVLVTADSQIFLSYAKKLPYVYVVPGKVTHIDFPGDNTGMAHIKDFLDLFMISKANHVYFYCYGRMYHSSHFSRTAALIGNKPYTMLQD